MEKSLHIEAWEITYWQCSQSGTVFLFFDTARSSRMRIQNIRKTILEPEMKIPARTPFLFQSKSQVRPSVAQVRCLHSSEPIIVDHRFATKRNI